MSHVCDLESEDESPEYRKIYDKLHLINGERAKVMLSLKLRESM